MNYVTPLAIVAILTLSAFFVFRSPPQDLPGNTRIDSSLEKLKSGDREDRVEALFALADLAADNQNAADLKYVVPAMVNAVADNDDLVRTAQKITLRRIGAAAAPFLGEFINSKEFRPYAFGCEAIRTLGPDAKMWLPELHRRLKELTDDEDDQAYLIATIEAIAALGVEAKPAMNDAMKYLDHENFKVVVATCKLVANIGPDAKSYGPRLVELANDGIASTRSWALIALGAIGPHEDYDVVQLLGDKLDAFLLIDKQRALEGLSLMGPEAKAALPKVEALMDDRTKSAMQYAAFAHWKISGDAQPSVQALRKLVKSRSYGEEAIQILGRMGPAAKDAVPELISQLKSTEPQRRENAIWALGDIGSEAGQATEPLEKLATDDEDILIREISKVVLIKINGKTAGQ